MDNGSRVSSQARTSNNDSKIIVIIFLIILLTLSALYIFIEYKTSEIEEILEYGETEPNYDNENISNELGVTISEKEDITSRENLVKKNSSDNKSELTQSSWENNSTHHNNENPIEDFFNSKIEIIHNYRTEKNNCIIGFGYSKDYIFSTINNGKDYTKSECITMAKQRLQEVGIISCNQLDEKFNGKLAKKYQYALPVKTIIVQSLTGGEHSLLYEITCEIESEYGKNLEIEGLDKFSISSSDIKINNSEISIFFTYEGKEEKGIYFKSGKIESLHQEIKCELEDVDLPGMYYYEEDAHFSEKKIFQGNVGELTFNCYDNVNPTAIELITTLNYKSLSDDSYLQTESFEISSKKQ